MDTKQQIIAAESSFVLQTYKRLPIVFERGEGCYLIDTEGKRYLDMVGGVAVNALGHCHPAMVKAITSQAATLIHASNLYYTTPMVQLAERLSALSGMKRVFFCNSGTEANEAAIKIARKWGKAQRGAQCHKIITFEHAFHGRTLGALSATGQKKYCEAFEPLVPGFIQLPLHALDQVRSALDGTACAVMIEPIQGEAGVQVVKPAFLRELRALCDEKNVLLIVDEVQTGIGRTGRWFGFEHAGVTPDLMPLAKGLGGGFPIGACMVGTKVEQTLVPGDHGSTFAGSPLAATAALAVLTTIEEDTILENVNRCGAALSSGMENLVSLDIVDHHRGMGLMQALELRTPKARDAVAKGLEFGLILNATGDTTLRFVPPLILTEAQVQECLQKLEKTLRSL